LSQMTKIMDSRRINIETVLNNPSEIYANFKEGSTFNRFKEESGRYIEMYLKELGYRKKYDHFYEAHFSEKGFSEKYFIENSCKEIGLLADDIFLSSDSTIHAEGSVIVVNNDKICLKKHFGNWNRENQYSYAMLTGFVGRKIELKASFFTNNTLSDFFPDGKHHYDFFKQNIEIFKPYIFA
jgi:hypothetical protein